MCAAECLLIAIFVKQRHFFSSLQEESVYSKAAVICLYCERFVGKFDVDSNRNRIDTSPEKGELSRLESTSLESWMIGDMLSVYGEIKI